MKSTKDKIKYFEKRVKYYFFDVFHIYDMALCINSQDKIGVKASTWWHPIDDGAGSIAIYFSKSWISHKDTTKEEIDMTAFHEVCEVILWELQELSKRRFISEKDIPNAVHRVIRRLENTIFPHIKDGSRRRRK